MSTYENKKNNDIENHIENKIRKYECKKIKKKTNNGDETRIENKKIVQ